MSGNNILTTDAPDVAALLAATQEALGQARPSRGGKADYEVTAGGFASPGQDDVMSSSPRPLPTTRSEETETILGAPQERVTALPPKEDVDDGIDYDAIIAGLTGSAQAERKARQEIQAALAEREAALASERSFRERYEPHIHELTTLWPEIEKQSAELEDVKRKDRLREQKLELYRAAAAEAGIEIDESPIDARFRQEQTDKLLQSIPDLIDQKLSKHFDSRIENYSRREQEDAERARVRAESDARAAYVAEKLDKFYAEKQDLKDFDRYIRPEVERDPNADLNLLAAPFMKLTATRSARNRAEERSKVDVGGTGATTSSAAARTADPFDPSRFTGMGIDAQLAALRREGLSF